MAYNRSQVAKLLSAAEMGLFEMSLADRIRTLSAVQLRGKRQRARSLRDKANDLLRRQKLKSRSRTGSKLGQSGAANSRTQKKAQIFAEALQRFEKRLEQIEGRPSRATAAGTPPRPPARRKPAQAAAKAPRGKNAPTAPTRSTTAPSAAPAGTARKGPGSDSARSKVQSARFKVLGSRAVQGHGRAVGRRNQAKRDQRG